MKRHPVKTDGLVLEWNRLGVADQTKIVINDMITYCAFIGSN